MREQKVSTRSLKIRDNDDRLEVPTLVGKWTDKLRQTVRSTEPNC